MLPAPAVSCLVDGALLCRGEPAGAGAAPAGFAVPAAADRQRGVRGVERTHRVEVTAAGVHPVGEVDADVAGVDAGAGDVVEARMVRVDLRIEQAQSVAAGLDLQRGDAREQR